MFDYINLPEEITHKILLYAIPTYDYMDELKDFLHNYEYRYFTVLIDIYQENDTLVFLIE